MFEECVGSLEAERRLRSSWFWSLWPGQGWSDVVKIGDTRFVSDMLISKLNFIHWTSSGQTQTGLSRQVCLPLTLYLYLLQVHKFLGILNTRIHKDV